MGTNFMVMVEHDEDDIDPAPSQGLMTMSDDIARTMYFALCDYRDKLVKDIAKYDDFPAAYYKECTAHSEFKKYCAECVTIAELRDRGHQLERTRDEDLMFLTDELHKTTLVLYFMVGGGDTEFKEWLAV